MEDPLLKFFGNKITSWRDLGIIRDAWHEGSFRAIAVLGPQGVGKTTLAVNIVLHRLFYGLKGLGVWKSDEDPLDDRFNPFERVYEQIGKDVEDRRKFSLRIAQLHKVVTPSDLFHFLAVMRAKQRQDKYGLVVDEAALWSKDVASWWGGNQKFALEVLRHFVTNIRGVTSLALIVAQDMSLIPAPIRRPIDLVLDVEEFKRESLPNAEVVVGVVKGTIKMRYTQSMRSPSAETRYYKVASFELKTYMHRELLSMDLRMKSMRLSAVIESRGNVKQLFRSFKMVKPRTALAGVLFLRNLLAGAYQYEDQGRTVVFHGVTAPALVAKYLRTVYGDAIADAKGDPPSGTLSRGDVTVICHPAPRSCYEIVKSIAYSISFV